MREIETRISSLVAAQFPNFYREDQARIIEFVKAYYEWMEQTGQAVKQSRSVLSYRDIDQTLEQFYSHFRKKYLESFPDTSEISTPFLVKNILDVYKAKGTEDGIKLLIQILYNEESSVYLPGTDVFKPSHGTWVVPQYLELSVTERTKSYLNKEILGEQSGARAFAESLVTRRINGKYIDVLYISNISGRFILGERIVETSNTINTNAPITVGSLSSIDILDGGQDLEVGDLLTIQSVSGKQGTARVTEISSETGVVSFSLNNGGFGFTTSANVLVSDRVLNLADISNANTLLKGPDPDLDFTLLESVTQAVYRYGVTGSANNSNFVANTLLTVYHPNNAIKSTGRIISFTAANSSAGYLRVYPISGSVSVSDVLRFPANSTSVIVANVLNSTASGVIIGSRPVTNTYPLSIGVVNVVNEFLATNVAPIIGSVSNTYAYVQLIGAGEGADFAVSRLSEEEDVILNTDLLAANNVGLIPFMNILVDGTNSNSTGYGFPKKASVGYNTGGVILDALTFVDVTIGVIEEIAGINRGQDYTQDPFVLVKEELVFPLDKRDFQLRVANVSGAFVNGEIVQQSFNTPMTVLNIANFAGNTVPELGERIAQANSTTANATVGIIYRFGSTGANIVSITATSVTGQGFVSNTAYPIRTLTSNATANIVSTASITTSTTARGIIENIANATFFTAKRISLANNFIAGSLLLGGTSGAQATLVDIYVDKFTAFEADRMNVAGINANVSANVQVANNVATNLEIVSSGFGYVNDETLTLVKEGSPVIVRGKANTYYNGVSSGFFSSTRGFVSEDKYIHDNFYYQEYSYEVRTKVPFAKYEPVLKNTMHVAGTRAFGKVVSASLANSALVVPDRANTVVSFSLNRSNTYTQSNTVLLNTGATVFQSNATSNTFVGRVITPSTTTMRTYPKENQVDVGTVIYWPLVTNWEMRATVVKKVVDAASNTSTLYLDNVTGVFPDNLHMQYLDSEGFERPLWSIRTINNVDVEVMSGTANSSSPLRFGTKQADIQHVTYRFI